MANVVCLQVCVDGEADDQVGRIQLRGGAPRAADRPGAGGHAAAAGTARPGFMGQCYNYYSLFGYVPMLMWFVQAS
jgi:hypothetical protein